MTSFAEMMTNRTGEQELSGWLAAVEADDQPYLHSFATGIRRDQDAVTAGLTLPYSSGTVEGNVNRIMLKRQMYGRAGFALLASASSSIPDNRITEFAPEPNFMIVHSSTSPLLPHSASH